MLTALHLLRRIVLILGLVAVLAATACTNDSESTPGPEAVSGPMITIFGNQFTVPSTVSPGATITVRNRDEAEHSVTAATPPPLDVEVHGGETATFTAPTSPGSYPIYCRYHPTMKATLVVV